MQSSAGATSGLESAGATGAVGEYLSYLDSISVLLAAPKKASIEALELEPGDAALDVGCGTGDDVRAMAEVVGPTGWAVGIDERPSHVEEARRRASGAHARFLVADAHAIPFADGAFAAARVERALQHVVDPRAAVAEMARVVRPGGRVVAMEPDWDTLAISSADLETTRAVLRTCADRIRNPDAGRRLPEWYALAGIELVRVNALAVPISSFDVADGVFDMTAAAEQLGAPVVGPWLDELRARERRGAFVACATGFGVVGVVH